VNNTSRGNIDGLANIPVALIEEIRYISPNEATSRWGTGHTAGVIEVILGVVRGRPESPPPTPGGLDTGRLGGAEPTTRREDLPFTPKPIFFVHSGSSLFHTPTEKREVWLPQVNIGAGVGVNASRTVTVFAAVEYHHFGFSESSAMEYLMSGEFSPIKDPDGVELLGSGNSILSFTANAKFHPRYGFIRPYLLIGAGYARLNSGTFSVSGPAGALLPQPQFYLQSATGGGQVENTVLYGGGLGFDLELAGHFRLFVDGRYFETIRGPRYNDVWNRNQIINTRFAPFRLGVTYK
jgi:opacity protein-like surface antigen